jgi:hypothetical protein
MAIAGEALKANIMAIELMFVLLLPPTCLLNLIAAMKLKLC